MDSAGRRPGDRVSTAPCNHRWRVEPEAAARVRVGRRSAAGGGTRLRSAAVWRRALLGRCSCPEAGRASEFHGLDARPPGSSLGRALRDPRSRDPASMPPPVDLRLAPPERGYPSVAPTVTAGTMDLLPNLHPGSGPLDFASRRLKTQSSARTSGALSRGVRAISAPAAALQRAHHGRHARIDGSNCRERRLSSDSPWRPATCAGVPRSQLIVHGSSRAE